MFGPGMREEQRERTPETRNAAESIVGYTGVAAAVFVLAILIAAFAYA